MGATASSAGIGGLQYGEVDRDPVLFAGLPEVLPQPQITTARSQPECREQNWDLSYPGTQSEAPLTLSKQLSAAMLQD